MPLRRFASLFVLCAMVPACSAIVSPDTTRLGDGPDSGRVTTDTGMPPVDTGMPPIDTGVDGGTSTCTTSCDDMIPCTTDGCTSGSCTHVPNNAACTVGMRCSATLGCVANACSGNADCADGNACNGTETCAPGTAGADPTSGCVPGTMLNCNDSVDCTTDSCNLATGCVHTASDAACDDTFDCTTDSCSPDGCRHETDDAACNGGCLMGAACVVGIGCTGGTAAMCMSDGDGCTSDPTTCDPGTGTCLHPPRDDDRDGFATASANGNPCPGGDDCDDTDPRVNPGATEICDGQDNNCNGAIDEMGCGPAGPENCASEGQIMLSSSGPGGLRGGMAMGGNVTNANDYTSSCGHANGRDAVYYVDIPGGVATGAVDVTFTTDGDATTFDTVLAAMVGTCGNFSTARCNDDINTGTNFRSRVTVCVSGALVSTGTRVHVLVDGFDDTATGNYTLGVVVTPRMTPCP